MKSKIQASSSMNVSAYMRDYVRGKILSLKPFLPEDATVFFSVGMSNQVIQEKMVVESKLYEIVVEEEGRDFYPIVDMLTDRLKKQILKRNEKLVSMKRKIEGNQEEDYDPARCSITYLYEDEDGNPEREIDMFFVGED